MEKVVEVEVLTKDDGDRYFYEAWARDPSSGRYVFLCFCGWGGEEEKISAVACKMFGENTKIVLV